MATSCGLQLASKIMRVASSHMFQKINKVKLLCFFQRLKMHNKKVPLHFRGVCNVYAICIYSPAFLHFYV